MKDQVNSFPNNKKRQRWRRLLRKKGSRKGYYADIDDFQACSSCSSDEKVAATTRSLPRRTHFYSHVSPRHRNKSNESRRKKRSNQVHQLSSCAHPDIDLSLVSLLSSKELDRRFGESFRSMSDSPSSSEVNNDSSSDSSESQQLNEEIIKNERKFPSTSAHPLAVVDYGSIELDMSGSLLDSIYKIGGQGHPRSRDLFIGGRRYSSNNETTPGDNHIDKPTDINRTRKVIDPLPSILEQSYSARRRSSDVVSVIATLKSTPSDTKATSSNSQEGPVCKRQKVERPAAKEVVLPEVDKAPTSLEAAISFSPFARVLFCAQAPYTIVHTNAAYSALVQQGLVKPCLVGDAFSSDVGDGVQISEEHISRIVANHMISLEHQDDQSLKGPRKMRSGFVHIFPVMSNDEAFSQFVRSYEKHHLLSCKDTEVISRRGIPSPSHGMSPSANQGANLPFTQYRSHYLLQIEPSSQMPI